MSIKKKNLPGLRQVTYLIDRYDGDRIFKLSRLIFNYNTCLKISIFYCAFLRSSRLGIRTINSRNSPLSI
jgi:hypothetical protein